MTNQLEPLTPDQLAALAAYATEHGRTWKSHLRDEWMTATAIGPVHALRNSHGPTWLTGFQFPKPEHGYAPGTAPAHTERDANGHYIVNYRQPVTQRDIVTMMDTPTADTVLRDRAVQIGQTLARAIFDKRGNHSEAHVTELELASFLGLAAIHAATDTPRANAGFDGQAQVYLVVVKFKSQNRIVRVDSAHATHQNAQTRKSTMYLAPNERAEILAKVLLSSEGK